ncbi:MAG: hypothetical protein H7067_05740 [Burkholderiales bacterium]|nr:hypothetical protein [Opitutaceae bacterium]
MPTPHPYSPSPLLLALSALAARSFAPRDPVAENAALEATDSPRTRFLPEGADLGRSLPENQEGRDEHVAGAWAYVWNPRGKPEREAPR